MARSQSSRDLDVTDAGCDPPVMSSCWSSNRVYPSYAALEQRRSTVHTENNNVIQTGESEAPQQRSTRNTVANAVNRVLGILDVPVVLIFGILLYLVDVGSDIAAGVSYFQGNHPIWGSITIGIVLVSAISWSAVSWTWWYYDDEKDKRPTYRKIRMALSVLLLDPLVR